MPPCGIVRAEFSVRDVPRLEGIVLGREIEIQGAGDQDRACPDRPERLPNVTTIERASADVARLPGRKLGKQVVGVPVLRVVGLPVDQQVLDRLEAESTIEPLSIESLRERPAGIDPAESLETRDRGRRISSRRRTTR